jgi:glycosyltransferase involved in cell wall biosynthesis
LKVLHLINSLSAGGAELQLLTLCRELKRRGVDVIVGCLREKVNGNRSLRPDFEAAGILVVDLQADGRYDWRFPARVVSLIERERPDMLHTHLPRADFAGAIARLLGRAPKWVCSLHAVYAESWSPKILLPLMRSAWQRADGVVAASAAVKEWVCGYGRVSADKVRVIHYGIDTSLFAADGDGARRSAAAGPVIGSVGRLEPGKGHQTLIRAMPRIVEKLPRASLRIAGHEVNGHGAELRGLADALGLNGRVQLLGFRGDMRNFFAEIDVFAFASRSEGFGQVVVEAMAARKPVVVGRIPSLEEIVVHGETGFLVDPEEPDEFADAVSWLTRHREEARRMMSRGYERAVSCFSPRVMADRTLSVYSEVLGN